MAERSRDSQQNGSTALTRTGGAVPRGAGAAILRALALGEKNVSDLVTITGLSQPNVSNHLARLKERGLVISARQGRQMFYRLATAGLANFVLLHPDVEPEPTSEIQEIAVQFLEAILTLREEEAVRVADAALAGGVGWKELYLKVFVPALERVGDLWEDGQLSVATEHLITGVVLRLLHRLSLNLPVAPDPGAPSALVGCVEGELHTMGGRMVADFLLAQGWRVWYLNGFLPMEHLLEAVRRHLPDAIVLCISTADCEEALKQTVERLQRWRGEQPLPLLVAGGRYFTMGDPGLGLDLWGTDIAAVTEEMHRAITAIRQPGSEESGPPSLLTG